MLAHYHAAIADRWGPPIGPSPPNPPLLQHRTSSLASSPSLSHPRVDSFSPQCLHPCANTREPSRRRSCSVESCRCCRLRSTLLHVEPPGCWCQPLGDEASSRLLHCRPAAASPMRAARSSYPLAHRGIASPCYANRPLSRLLCHHDVDAKHPATRPRAASLLPPPLLAPWAGIV
jgi:hypothetical protein